MFRRTPTVLGRAPLPSTRSRAISSRFSSVNRTLNSPQRIPNRTEGHALFKERRVRPQAEPGKPIICILTFFSSCRPWDSPPARCCCCSSPVLSKKDQQLFPIFDVPIIRPVSYRPRARPSVGARAEQRQRRRARFTPGQPLRPSSRVDRRTERLRLGARRRASRLLFRDRRKGGGCETSARAHRRAS